MDKFVKELYMILINNTDLLLVNDKLISEINNSLIQYTVTNNSALHNFINVYKSTLLLNDTNIDLLKKNLYNATNNKQLKQYINKLNISEFITKLTKTDLFKIMFNKYFIILTIADDIIDNVCYDQDWLQMTLSHILDKLYQFIINKATQNNISAEEQILSLMDNNNELITFCSYELQEIYNINKFFIDTINIKKINNDFYPLLLRGKIKHTEFFKVAQYLLNKYNDIIMNYFIDNSDFIQADINAHSASELDKIDIKKGESIPINGALFHELTHSDKYIPIIYVNGNVITGQIVHDIKNGRIHHSSLFKAYCKDMQLHKFDKIKKSKEEWSNLVKDISSYSEEMSLLMDKYQCVRAVQSVNGTAVAIIAAYHNVKEAADAFKNQLANCNKVFACNDSWTELKEAKIKRLMIKI